MKKSVLKNITNTAYTLFKEKGYEQTTIMDICDACGITKTTFYRYVNSKEELLSYFFSDIHDNLGSLIVSIAHADNYWQQIICAFDIIIQQMEKFDKDLYRQLYISSLKNLTDPFDEIPLLKDILVTIIEKAQESGQIKNNNSPKDLYYVCKDLCFGCGILWCLDQIKDIREVFIKDMRIALQVTIEES